MSCEIKSRIAMAKAAFSKTTLHQQIGFQFKEETSKMLHLKNNFVWCWRKIRWNDHVKNEVLHRAKKERHTLHTIKMRTATWIGHILHRNYLLKCVIEGKIEGRIEVIGRRGRRCKQLLNDLRAARRYWKLKEEARDCTPQRTQFGRGLSTWCMTD
jgi:hypothetical protein